MARTKITARRARSPLRTLDLPLNAKPPTPPPLPNMCVGKVVVVDSMGHYNHNMLHVRDDHCNVRIVTNKQLSIKQFGKSCLPYNMRCAFAIAVEE